MENITYRDQIIWGTSLGMAKDDEIDQCYDYVAKIVEEDDANYMICNESSTKKGFIDIRWNCGEAVHSQDLCDKAKSIKQEDLQKLIEDIVSAEDITIEGQNVIKTFKKRNYIDIYKCGRVFFIK